MDLASFSAPAYPPVAPSRATPHGGLPSEGVSTRSNINRVETVQNLLLFHGFRCVFLPLHLGVHQLYMINFSFTASTALANLALDLTSPTRLQWNLKVGRMAKTWKLVFAITMVLTPLSITFLQLESVSGHQWATNFSVASCIFAVEGLAASSLLLVSNSKLRSDNVRLKWYQASRLPKSLGAMQFWSYLSLAAACAVWSLGFSLATLSFIVIDMHVGSPKMASTEGILLCKIATGLIGNLAALALIQSYKLYRLLSE